MPTTALKFSLASATLMLVSLADSAAAPRDGSYEGQALRLTVNSTPGSGTDVFARLVAPAIGRNLPGHPSVTVENKPGAGGLVAANHFFNVAKPDGLSIGLFFGIVTSGFLGGDTARFQPEKFRWLGAVSATQVLLARRELKITGPADLLKPVQPLVLAGTSNSTNDVANQLFLNMIGAEYKRVTGYPGQPEQLLALNRGEVNLANAGLPLYLSRRASMDEASVYEAVVQRGELGSDGRFVRNHLIAEIPTMAEVVEQLNPAALHSVDFAAYKSVVGAFRLNWGFVVPPGTDDAVVLTLGTAIRRALEDDDVKEQVRRNMHIDYDFIDAPNAERILATLAREFHSDPRIGSLIGTLMSRN